MQMEKKKKTMVFRKKIEKCETVKEFLRLSSLQVTSLKEERHLRGHSRTTPTRTPAAVRFQMRR